MYFRLFTHTIISRLIFWVMYYLEIQGLFKDVCHNSRAFQGFMQIQGLFKDVCHNSRAFQGFMQIQGLFKDVCHNSRAFPGFMRNQGLFKTSSYIQGLFNTVRTLNNNNNKENGWGDRRSGLRLGL